MSCIKSCNVHLMALFDVFAARKLPIRRGMYTTQCRHPLHVLPVRMHTAVSSDDCKLCTSMTRGAAWIGQHYLRYCTRKHLQTADADLPSVMTAITPASMPRRFTFALPNKTENRLTGNTAPALPREHPSACPVVTYLYPHLPSTGCPCKPS